MLAGIERKRTFLARSPAGGLSYIFVGKVVAAFLQATAADLLAAPLVKVPGHPEESVEIPAINGLDGLGADLAHGHEGECHRAATSLAMPMDGQTRGSP